MRSDKRTVLIVPIVGLLVATVAAAGTFLAQNISGPERYRAEAQVVLVPGRQAPVEEISSLWEALSRGQAAVIGAEVMGQRRWLEPAAAAADVAEEELTLSAGAVTDTTLINVSVEASSARAAEIATEAAVREARPLVEQVTGPFALEIVQGAEGSAEVVGADRFQALVVAGVAGLVLGSGVALAVVRRRERGSIVGGPADGTPDPERNGYLGHPMPTGEPRPSAPPVRRPPSPRPPVEVTPDRRPVEHATRFRANADGSVTTGAP
jgi:capsular polysaccharide biosynthesis protein